MNPGPGEKFDYLLKGMKDREKRGESLESPKNSIDSRVSNQESRVSNQESIVSTETHPARIETLEPIVNSLESRVGSIEPIVNSLESRVGSIDYTVLAEAIEEANRKPKLGVYSPLAAAILRYKAITTPRYSMGSELRAVIEQALKERYPELSEQVEKALAKK